MFQSPLQWHLGSQKCNAVSDAIFPSIAMHQVAMQWGPIFTKESNAIQSLAMQCSCSSIAISPRLNAMEGFFQKPSRIILSSCSAAGVLSALFDITAPRSLCCIISQLAHDQFLTRSGPIISQVTQRTNTWTILWLVRAQPSSDMFASLQDIQSYPNISSREGARYQVHQVTLWIQ